MCVCACFCRWEDVEQGKQVDDLPEWCKWSLDAPPTRPDENLGLFAGGKEGTREIEKLGNPLGMESGEIKDHQVRLSHAFRSWGSKGDMANRREIEALGGIRVRIFLSENEDRNMAGRRQKLDRGVLSQEDVLAVYSC